MAARDVIRLKARTFVGPQSKGYYRYRSQIRRICSSLKILTGNIFGLILKNKMAATGVSLSVMKSAYISLIIGPRGLGW